MKLVLKFRGSIQAVIDWPDAPPTFKHPWKTPISVVSTKDTGYTPDKPLMKYVEYKRSDYDFPQGLAFYEANYSDVQNL